MAAKRRVPLRARIEMSGAWVISDLSDVARAVLLAFADLGIYLPSPRERLMLKIQALDPLDAAELAEFIDLCIEAELLTDADAGRLRLSPLEAKRLAASLDGHTPVPEDQADDWAKLLGGSPA
ncbi:MAG: hypothetical protein E6J14_06950 [Chloroflexi bacterium]|nr:MAG: hypothetical protein E6J14_06950 [Chloroflexota bacterium]